MLLISWILALYSIVDRRVSQLANGNALQSALGSRFAFQKDRAGMVTERLSLQDQDIAVILDGGFDACPYTEATGLWLNHTAITAVGARACTRCSVRWQATPCWRRCGWRG